MNGLTGYQETVAGLLRESLDFAAALHEQRFGKNDVVMLMGNYCPRYFYAILGCAFNCTTIVPISSEYHQGKKYYFGI